MNQTRHILAHKPVRKHCASGLSERGSHERVLQLLLWFPSVSRAWMKPPHSDLSNYMWIKVNDRENQIKETRPTKKLNRCINSYGPSVLKVSCLILLSLGFSSASSISHYLATARLILECTNRRHKDGGRESIVEPSKYSRSPCICLHLSYKAINSPAFFS